MEWRLLQNKGRIIWRLVFGVVMAGMLIGVLLTYTYTQTQFAEEEEAQSLANELSRTAFSAIDTERSIKLPASIGGNPYEIDIFENNTFAVRIFDEEQENILFKSSVSVNLDRSFLQNDTMPEPGEEIFFRGDQADTVYISDESIELDPNEIEIIEGEFPVDFYELYENSPEKTADLIYQFFYEDESTSENGDLEYVKKAYNQGWLYSPSEAKERVLRRSWRNEEGDIVRLSDISEEEINTHVFETTKLDHVVWKMEFEDFTIFYRTFQWKPSLEKPGFVFHSEPYLEAA